ncbi:MAG: N-alpha-acetyl diaminobutyric acid deacetylase DoeB [Rhodospirillaceae bacterium]|jgi:N2-acetyl-L-2,4-diaminobutanoate deacetylase|nr:N-alpha-acetyl diaminobutyric acid deacetylase DoeB [Rhodospirillaceae bacterium]
MRDSPITASIDFDKDGVRHGFLKLPHSSDASAWGSIMIPLTVARNGAGPTLLVTGGNHGDEYEGPIALFDLAQSIRAEDLSGRVIIIPAMNYPAFRSASRTSPLDGGNLNRLFPGAPDGNVTEKIADYFQRVLLPQADYVIDLHSGGKSLDFVPFCAAHVLDDKAQQDRCVGAMAAFNAPYSVMMLEPDAVGLYDTSAEDMGKIFITTELGGGGTARGNTVAIAKKGVDNVLRHAGILPGAPDQSPSIRLEMPDHRCFVQSETAGLLEPCLELGDPVAKGQILARIHNIERTGVSPIPYRSPLDGIFAGRHVPGLIAMGDMIAVIAVKT